MIFLKVTLFNVEIEIWAFIISLLALVFTFLKDFINPLVFKPKLHFNYDNRRPYRRDGVIVNRDPTTIGSFFRLSVTNNGLKPAINCRCQILKVEQNSNLFGDYQGFPLRWASRPESIIDKSKGERLNIARGETEFIDLGVSTNKTNLVYLQKYHDVDVGIKEVIEPGNYLITLLFSGDNFKPKEIKLSLLKEDSLNPKEMSLMLL